MNARAIVRLLSLGLFAFAVDCKSPTLPPPPPPPAGAPVVHAGQDVSVQVGTPYQLAATFNDTTTNAAPWEYGINWGDGSNTTGTKNTISPITGSHTYASAGTFEVKVSVTNSRGMTGNGSLTVGATEAPAPVILAAGDIGDCNRTTDNATGALLETLQGTVMPLGDNAYESGTPTEFADCYDPAWGAVKGRTRPVAGNHDYYNPGATKNADGYFGYFGSAAGDPAKGYYDFTLGSWLVIVLNTGTESGSFIAAGSAQEQWLRAELAKHSGLCAVAMFHHPQFSTLKDRPFIRPETTPLWQALYDGGVDLVLNGHDHTYQRFKPMRPDGTADAAFGIRQITVGTGGGETLYAFDPSVTNPNLEVRNSDTWGVLKLTLHPSSYDWQFIRATGGSFTDSGTGTCHGRPS